MIGAEPLRNLIGEGLPAFGSQDWLETLNTQAESTLTGYRSMVRHLMELIGSVKLKELKVRDVDFALGKLAEHLSTRSVRLARTVRLPVRLPRP